MGNCETTALPVEPFVEGWLLALLLLSVNGELAVADGDIIEDDRPLLGAVEDVDCLLETV